MISQSSQNSCPTTIGSDSKQPQRQVTSGLLINFRNPAICGGMVTAWSFCFHRPSRNGEHSARFVVYRKTPDNENRYRAVNGSIHTVRLDRTDEPFNCTTMNLTESEVFHIEPSDVIGACLVGNRPLDLVSGGGNATQVYLSRDHNCVNIEGIDISTNFESVDTLILHLRIHVGKINSYRFPYKQNSCIDS